MTQELEELDNSQDQDSALKLDINFQDQNGAQELKELLDDAINHELDSQDQNSAQELEELDDSQDQGTQNMQGSQEIDEEIEQGK